MTPQNPQKHLKVYEFFMTEATSLLMRLGESPECAEKLAETFVTRVFKALGGTQLYFPKGHCKKSAAKRAALKSEYKEGAESVDEFARRHNISVVWAYKILKEANSGICQPKLNPDVLLVIVEATRMIVTTGISIQDAGPMAKDFISVLLAKKGGTHVYIPSMAMISIYKRSDDIWKQYQVGHTISEIASQYGLTRACISQIIRPRCQKAGIATPAEKRKKSPLALLKCRVLQIADDYKLSNQLTYDKLQQIAGQLDNIEQSLKNKEYGSTEVE